jgi:transcriptional regulator with GAF, ATPase, and Fis domain
MLASLSVMGQQLSSSLDLDRILGSILAMSHQNTRAGKSTVFLLDEVTGEVSAVAMRGMDPASSIYAQKIADMALRQAKPDSIALRPLVRKTTLSDSASVLCIPMVFRDKLIGAIYLESGGSEGPFAEDERAFVESFASHAAVAIENARLFGQMRAENLRLQHEVQGRFKDIIGSSSAISKVRRVMAGVLANDSTVLLTGESGTGKGMVARAIHTNGQRHVGPFIEVDCGALPENLLEAELFGYAKGAFTGADRERVGLIEEARGGTLFLDEIGNTTPALQARLLRVLQEREVRRLGENAVRSVNVRVIAATNADLRALMSQGRFRQDLFYRLNVVAIEVPPLRDRLEDMTAMVDHFLRRYPSRDGVVKRLGPGVMRAFGRYSWPGNVRELQHAIERLVLLSAGDIISVDDLPDELRADPGEARRNPDPVDMASHIQRRSVRMSEGPKSGEQLMIEDALRRYAGDKAKAARFIGWNRQKLYRRMRSFRIPKAYGRKAA